MAMPGTAMQAIDRGRWAGTKPTVNHAEPSCGARRTGRRPMTGPAPANKQREKSRTRSTPHSDAAMGHWCMTLKSSCCTLLRVTITHWANQPRKAADRLTLAAAACAGGHSASGHPATLRAAA